MEGALISVIVPIYNVEKYLKKCLDSICRQTYKNLEIILVDDGSPDNCGAICDNYAKLDKRIKVIHKENGGLSSARNSGLDIASGEYISFIDSDDIISEKFIETLYKLCIKNNSDIAECDFVKFENEIIEDNKDSSIQIFSKNEMQNRIYSEYSVRTTVVWNKLYKSYIYGKIRFPVGKIHEDEFCTYKAFYNCKTKVVVTNEKLYYYRYSQNSITGKKFNKKRLDIIDAYEERKDFYKRNDEIDFYLETIKNYIEVVRYRYELTKENIVDSKDILQNLHNIAKNNYKELAKYKKIKMKFAIKNLSFILFPNIYFQCKKIYNKYIRKKLNLC